MPSTREPFLPRPQEETGYENPGGWGCRYCLPQRQAGRGTGTAARLPSQLLAPVGDRTGAHACRLRTSNRRADPRRAGACGHGAGAARRRAAQREPPADTHTCPQRWQSGCCHPCSHPLLSARGELERGTVAAAELRAAASPHGAGAVSAGRAARDVEPELHRRTQGHSSPLMVACTGDVLTAATAEPQQCETVPGSRLPATAGSAPSPAGLTAMLEPLHFSLPRCNHKFYWQDSLGGFLRTASVP